MTRLTPSDQAGTGSAPGSATIPPQRSPRSLRLLVLGTGDPAAALRARAADAGAELAQRFSSRVTHVVVDGTIGEDDARVTRARTAGLPVLSIEQGDELLGTRDERGEVAAAEVVAADVVEVEVEGAGPGAAQADGEAGEEFRVEPVAVEEVERGEAAWIGIGEAEPIDVIRPRYEPEYAAQSLEDGPTNVFGGSALEAVLLFPPLPAEGSVGTCGCGEIDGGEGVGSAEGSGDEGESGVGVEVRAEGGGLSGAAAELVGMQALVERDEDFAADVDVAGVMAGDVVLGHGSETSAADDALAATPAETQTPVAAAGSIAWALVPLASLGLLTPVAMGYAAYRLRSRPLAFATGWYTVAVTAAFAVSAAAPRGGGAAHSAVSDLLTACLATSWLGGTIHSFLIRRRVFS